MWYSPLVVLFNLIPLYFAYLVSRRGRAQANWATRSSETILGYLAIVQVTLFALGMIGCLRIEYVSGVICCLGIGCWYLQRTQPTEIQQTIPQFGEAKRSSLFNLILAVAFAMLIHHIGQWAKFYCLRATELQGDDYWYRYSIPIYWLANHDISTDRLFGFTGSYPKGAELYSIWFMLPFQNLSQSDCLTWTNWTSLPFLLLAIASINRLFNHDEQNPSWGWLVGVCLLCTSKIIDLLVLEYATIDLAGPCLLLSAFAMLRELSHAQASIPAVWYRRVIYLSIAVGLAVGIKMLALPVATVLMLYVYWRAYRGGGVKRMICTLMLTISVCVIVAGYWYIRNLLIYGNPFFPARFLGLPHLEWIYHRSTLNEYFRTFGFSKGIADSVRVFFNWPYVHGVVALLGGVAGVILAVRPIGQQDHRVFSRLAVISASFCLLLLPGQPWSAGHEQTFQLAEIHTTNMRYITFVPVLGWVLLSLLLMTPGRLEQCRLLVMLSILFAILLSKVTNHFQAAPRVGKLFEYVIVVVLIFACLQQQRFRLQWPAAYNPRPYLLGVLMLCLLFPLVILGHHLKYQQAVRLNYDRIIGLEMKEAVDELNRYEQCFVIGQDRGLSLLLGERFQHIALTVDERQQPKVLQPRYRQQRADTGIPAESPVRWERIDFVVILHQNAHGVPIPSPLYEQVRNNPIFSIRKQAKGITLFARKDFPFPE